MTLSTSGQTFQDVPINICNDEVSCPMEKLEIYQDGQCYFTDDDSDWEIAEECRTTIFLQTAGIKS